jgi:type II secretory pathway component PulM
MAVLLLGAACLFIFAFEPAWQGRQAIEERLAALRSQAASVERIGREARELESLSRAPMQSVQAVRVAIEHSIDTAGLRGSLVRLQANGALLDLEFRQVSFAALVVWLEGAARDHRIRILDVSLTRESTSGRVSGRLLLEHPQGAAAAPGAK